MKTIQEVSGLLLDGLVRIDIDEPTVRKTRVVIKDHFEHKDQLIEVIDSACSTVGETDRLNDHVWEVVKDCLEYLQDAPQDIEDYFEYLQGYSNTLNLSVYELLDWLKEDVDRLGLVEELICGTFSQSENVKYEEDYYGNYISSINLIEAFKATYRKEIDNIGYAVLGVLYHLIETDSI